jgi:hypothetical protein
VTKGAEPEPVHPVTVLLTRREMTALAAVAFVCTSIDDEAHRANLAEAALKKVQEAVRLRGP